MVVDDHGLMCAGIRAVLDEYADMEFVGEASDGREAIALYGSLQPDVVLMDIRMGGPQDGINATRDIVRLHPEAKVLALTTYDDGDLVRAMMAAGASGFLTKSISNDNLIEAIRNVSRELFLFSAEAVRSMTSRLADPFELTAREHEIAELLHLSNKQIAVKLGISKRTVEAHIHSIFDKLGADNRTDAVAQYQKLMAK
jgi:DNA-binding NarL/FixJ family response regulator